VSSRRFRPLSTAQLAGGLAGFSLMLLLIAAGERGFAPLLDHANLAMHEAGHLLYGIFGATAELYGGTLGQLTFPVVAAAIFFHRREAVGLALSAGWFFENFQNIARYAADARAQELPLVGGGGHDWEAILLRWHALDSDLRVARAFRRLGWVGLAAAIAWLVWMWAAPRYLRKAE
jgi:hypothetical protein